MNENLIYRFRSDHLLQKFTQSIFPASCGERIISIFTVNPLYWISLEITIEQGIGLTWLQARILLIN